MSISYVWSVAVIVFEPTFIEDKPRIMTLDMLLYILSCWGQVNFRLPSTSMNSLRVYMDILKGVIPNDGSLVLHNSLETQGIRHSHIAVSLITDTQKAEKSAALKKFQKSIYSLMLEQTSHCTCPATHTEPYCCLSVESRFPTNHHAPAVTYAIFG